MGPWEVGAEKKSERANNTGQARGASQTHKQRQLCRCAGTQTKKKRRPDCPKRVGGGRFAGGSKTACIGRAKEGKYFKVRGGRHMKAGQETEIYSYPL